MGYKRRWSCYNTSSVRIKLFFVFKKMPRRTPVSTEGNNMSGFKVGSLNHEGFRSKWTFKQPFKAYPLGK